jgi:hypothetical protein
MAFRLVAFVVAALVVVSCVTDDDRHRVKSLVTERYPTFEMDVQTTITTKYGSAPFANQKWEWQVEAAPKKHTWRVRYGSFRVLTLGEVMVGEAISDLSGELTGGLLSFNPRAEGKGIYVELLVNSESRTVTLR